MKKIIIVLLCELYCSVCGVEQRGLILAFDQIEKDFKGAVAYDILPALTEKTVPVVLSGHFFNIFLKNYSEAKNNKLDTKNVKAYFVLHQMTFDLSEWRIFYIAIDGNPDYFYLLIPRGYINDRLPLYKTGEAIAETVWPVVLEQLGFNSTLPSPLVSTVNDLQAFVEQHHGNKNLQNVTQVTQFLKALFQKRGPQLMEWTLFIVGHGMANSTVAGLPIDVFSTVLDFCESSLTTKLLVYMTCYGTGSSAETVFNDSKQAAGPVARVYSFAIVSDAIGDFMTGSNPYADYTTFFKRAFEAQIPINYGFVIEPVVRPIDVRSLYTFGKDMLSGAQIRLPGLPWFSVVEGQDRIVSLTRILMATCDPEKVLSVKNLFDRQRSKNPTQTSTIPMAVLLYTDTISCPLDLHTGFTYRENFSDLPRFISPLPGLVVTVLSTMQYPPGVTIQKILSTFATYTGSDIYPLAAMARKIYLIERIEFGDEVVTNVLIDVKSKESPLFFEKIENNRPVPYKIVFGDLVSKLNSDTVLVVSIENDPILVKQYAAEVQNARMTWNTQQERLRMSGTFTLAPKALNLLTKNLKNINTKKIEEIKKMPAVKPGPGWKPKKAKVEAPTPTPTLEPVFVPATNREPAVGVSSSGVGSAVYRKSGGRSRRRLRSPRRKKIRR